MDLLCVVCLVLSIGTWFASAERHSVYWNSSNPKLVPTCACVKYTFTVCFWGVPSLAFVSGDVCASLKEW